MNNEPKKPLLAGYQYDGDDIVTSYVSVPSGVIPDELVGSRTQMMGWSELKDHPLPRDFRKYVMRTAYAAGVEHCFFVKGEMFFGPVTIGPSPLPFWVNMALIKKTDISKEVFSFLDDVDDDISEGTDLMLKDKLQARLDNLFHDVWKDAKSQALGIPDRGNDLAVRPQQLGTDADGGQGPGQGAA
jgi:hypothetical protein